jgi:hypothetical protein
LTVTWKYGRTRLLPLHPTVAAGLNGYLTTRAALLPAAKCQHCSSTPTGGVWARAAPTPRRRFNGRVEHLRGSALGFRNLTHYIARSLLKAGVRARPALSIVKSL